MCVLIMTSFCVISSRFRKDLETIIQNLEFYSVFSKLWECKGYPVRKVHFTNALVVTQLKVFVNKSNIFEYKILFWSSEETQTINKRIWKSIKCSHNTRKEGKQKTVFYHCGWATKSYVKKFFFFLTSSSRSRRAQHSPHFLRKVLISSVKFFRV